MAKKSYGLDMLGPLYLELVDTIHTNPTLYERRIVYDINYKRVRYSNGIQWVDVEYIQPDPVTQVPRIVIPFSNSTTLTNIDIGKPVYFDKNTESLQLASSNSFDTLAQGFLYEWNSPTDYSMIICGLCNKFSNLQPGHFYCLGPTANLLEISDPQAKSLKYINILLYATNQSAGVVYSFKTIVNTVRKTNPSLFPVSEQAVSNVIANAPDILDTLNEIANAIDNDPDFYKSVYHRTSDVIKHRLLSCADTYDINNIPYSDDEYMVYKTSGLYGVNNPPTYVDTSPSDSFLNTNKDIIIPTYGFVNDNFQRKKTENIQRDFVFYGNFIQNTGANNRDMIYYALQSLFEWRLQSAKITGINTGVFDEQFHENTTIKIRNLTKGEDLSNEIALASFNPNNGLNDNSWQIIGNRTIDTNDRLGIILTQGYSSSNMDSRTLTVSIKFEII